jgi:two-component system response regulator HydG
MTNPDSAGSAASSTPLEPPSSRPFKSLVTEYERSLILEALAATGGNQRQAAGLLQLLPTTLHEKMKRLGLLDRSPAAGTEGEGWTR